MKNLCILILGLALVVALAALLMRTGHTPTFYYHPQPIIHAQ